MKRLALILTPILFLPTVALANAASQLCAGAEIGGGPSCAGTGSSGLTNSISTGVNLLLYIAGALAVLVIIYGGIRYITSTGDSSRVKAAKDTVIYGIVGLIVALLAYAIVKYVTDNIH